MARDKRAGRERKKTAVDADGLRTCIASGVRKPKEEMVRFVIGPDATAVPDLDEKLPGRGFWLSAERDVIHTACARNLFSKRARSQIVAKEDLAARVEDLLVRRCVALLQMARRSGQLTAGADEVGRRLEKGRGGLLVTAIDAAPGGRRKVVERAPQVPQAAALTGDEMGLALGRERVAHALVEPGGMADRLARELGRLAGLRAPAEAAGTAA